MIQIQISITDKCKVAARPGLETCSLVCCGILLMYAGLTRLRTFSVLHHRLMGCGALPHCKFSLLTTLLDNQHGSQSSQHEDNSLYTDCPRPVLNSRPTRGPGRTTLLPVLIGPVLPPGQTSLGEFTRPGSSQCASVIGLRADANPQIGRG